MPTPRGCLHKDYQAGCRRPPLEKNGHKIPLAGDPHCSDIEYYYEVPKISLLDLLEDDITWLTSKLSGAAGATLVEATKLKHSMLRFRYASEELRDIIPEMVDCISNYLSPWNSWQEVMTWWLVMMDKLPGVRPMVIGETLRIYLANIVLRVTGNQEKVDCGNLRIYVGLEASIEDELCMSNNYVVMQWYLRVNKVSIYISLFRLSKEIDILLWI